MSVVTIPHSAHIDYLVQGNIRTVFHCRDKELLVEGAAGTGKSRGILEKLDMICRKYKGARVAIVRKTRVSMTQTILVTLEDEVLVGTGIKLHSTNQEYKYPNGSVIVVGGMDKPEKILSSAYDVVFVNEATELSLRDWETLITRLRNNKMPYQQIIADCNPSFSAHWLNQRALSGMMTRITTKHEDNAAYYDADKKQYTGIGHEYIFNTLEKLTGVRYLRYRKGLWASAEGLVYDDFDPSVHIVPRFDIPSDWRKVRAIDFGFTNPFTCLWGAIDNDGRLYIYRYIYHTQRTVRVHAETINKFKDTTDYPYADHDAEDRATLAESGIFTYPANKAVGVGIQKVQERLKPAGDGKPRLFILQDSLVELDTRLKDKGLPFTLEDEFSSYVWNDKKDVPVKEYDHALDALRYMVMALDDRPPAVIQL